MTEPENNRSTETVPVTVPEPAEEGLTRRQEAALIVVTVVVIVLLWVASWVAVRWPQSPAHIPSTEERARLGDAFGAINALFSGLALAGVAIAIYFQREELRLQRRELRDTKMELARAADAQHQSAQVMKDQLELQWLQRQPQFFNWRYHDIQSEPTDPRSVLSLWNRGASIQAVHIAEFWADGLTPSAGGPGYVPTNSEYITVTFRPMPLSYPVRPPVLFSLDYLTASGQAGRATCAALLQSPTKAVFHVVSMCPLERYPFD